MVDTPPAVPAVLLPTFHPLSIVDKLTGGPALGVTTIKLARVLQALLGTGSVALVGLIALDLFGTRTAVIALALAALYPVWLELSSVIVAENLLTVLELAAVYAALRARRSAAPLGWVLGTGLALGLATLTHTNAALLVIPLAFALRRRPLPDWMRRLPAPALMVIVALLTVTPWLIRDASVFHQFVPISTENGITLAGTYNPTSAASNPPYMWHLYTEVPSLRSISNEAHSLNEVQLSNKLAGRSLSYIAHHPLSPLSVAFHNTLRLLELEGSFAWKASASSIGLDLGLAKIGVLSFWLLVIVALFGIRTQAIRRVPGWFWGVPLVMWITVAFVNAETPRFREPLDPFVLLLAACALTAAWERWQPRPATTTTA
jgi:4-amino-4-deoxy-L-arabinose transferase-like glycosyltransferase